MCGIAGIVALAPGAAAADPLRVASMIGALAHRGPDEFGLYRDDRAALGHARLAIIDLASGQQPLSNEAGDLWVVFNGEIFNYLELRQELESRGHHFRTKSDTEVIVHAYEEWQDACFRRFNGQWAIALWNSTTRTLVLARDPYGVRPLYLAEHQGRVVFASEVKALFTGVPDLPRRFDAAGLDQVFTFWTSVAPRTVFAGVEELRPAEVRTYRDGRLHSTDSCWTPSYATATSHYQGSLEDAVHDVRQALEAATRLRMLRADVPVGSYLSGGLDSSMIAALGLRAKGSRFSTFSLRFEDAEYDETAHQRAMSRFIGSDHHEVMATRADIAAIFPDVIWHAERPVLRTAPAPLFLLSRLVRQAGIKVVLTGEGADEMFAGYDLFREGKVRRFWSRQPSSDRRPRLLERLYPYLDRSPVSQGAVMRQFFGQRLDAAAEPGFAHQVRWRGAAALKRLLTPSIREAAGPDVLHEFLSGLPDALREWSPLGQDQYIEIRTLLSGYLLSSQGDRMLMANSVEGRFPFLDRGVAALADSLPPSYKLRVLDEKHVLKRAAADLIPASILGRKKQPYRSPDALSFAHRAASDWIDDVASPARLHEAEVFAPAAARQIIEKCRHRASEGQFSNADNMAVVGILSTQLLHHRFIRQAPQAVAPARIQTIVDRSSAPAIAP